MASIYDHFIAPLYMMTFEQYPHRMLKEAMEALLNIVDWFTSPNGNFIRMYNEEKALYALSWFSMDKLVMPEVAYHISIGL